MKFQDTGLEKNELVEKAFDYSWKTHTKAFDREIELTKKDVERQITAEVDRLDKDPRFNDEQKKQIKSRLQHQKQQILAQIPLKAMEARDDTYQKNVVGPAKLLTETSDKTSPELISAVMLVDSIRSPLDYEKVSKEFGEGVAGVVAEFLHIQAYPSEKEANLPTATEDVKRMTLAMVVNGLDQLAEVSKNLGPGQAIVLSGGDEQAKSFFRAAEIVRGTDSKLDEKFVDSFNAASKVTGWGAEVKDGKLTLVEKEKPKMPNIFGDPNDPNNPAGPGGAAGGGDDKSIGEGFNIDPTKKGPKGPGGGGIGQW